MNLMLHRRAMKDGKYITIIQTTNLNRTRTNAAQTLIQETLSCSWDPKCLAVKNCLESVTSVEYTHFSRVHD